MKGNGSKAKVVVSVLMGAALLLGAAAPALADDRDRHDFDRDHDHGHDRDGRWFYTGHYFPVGHELRELPRDVFRLTHCGLEYFYFEGLFYRFRDDRYIVVEAPVGAVVAAIPTCQPVIIDGLAYYMINGNTYIATSTGYIVASPPAVVPAPAPAPVAVAQPPAVPVAPPPPPAQPVASDNTFTVNIPNARGTFTPVTVTRSGSGFIGPQGEFYPEFPRVEQLKVMYGK